MVEFDRRDDGQSSLDPSDSESQVEYLSQSEEEEQMSPELDSDVGQDEDDLESTMGSAHLPKSGNGATPAASSVGGSLMEEVDHIRVDARIYELSSLGHQRPAIATRIKAELGLELAVDAVGKRLRAYVARKRDVLDADLDARLKDWHDEDDAELAKSVDLTREEQEKQIAQIREKFWQSVADRMVDSAKQRKRSARACRERHEGIEDGTGEPSIEADPDKQARAQRRVAERAHFKEVRDALLVRHAAEEKAAQEERRAAQKLKEKLRLEAAHRAAAKAANRAEKERARKVTQEIQLNQQRLQQWQLDRTEIEGSIIERLTVPKGGRKRVRPPVEEPAAKRKKVEPQPPAVTRASLENPRSVMSQTQLEVLLVNRNLPRRRAEEDHAQLVARLNAADELLEIFALDDMIDERMIPINRRLTKAEKINYIQNWDAGQASAMKATDDDFKAAYKMYERHNIER